MVVALDSRFLVCIFLINKPFFVQSFLNGAYCSDVSGRMSVYDDNSNSNAPPLAKRQRTDANVRPASVTVWSQA